MHKFARLLTLLVVGLVLSGCDKCGDFFWDSKSAAPLACKGTGPSGL